MGNRSSAWLNITGVICYFMGISFLTTLILIPVAIYCFIGGSKYFTWANMSDTELYNYKRNLKNWGIFVSIVAFPIGLISIIPFIKTGNNPVVTNVKEDKQRKEESQEKAEEIGIKVEKQSEPKADHKTTVSTKEETIEKLKKFRDDGLITEAEYKRAVSELNKE